MENFYSKDLISREVSGVFPYNFLTFLALLTFGETDWRCFLLEKFCSAVAILGCTGNFQVLIVHTFAPCEYGEEMIWAVSIILW